MLVLAGVSINAIIGDNGVITNAQRANILNSCAILQEFLETQVGTDFEALGTYENKVDYIVNKYPNYLYKPNASTSFITDSATGFIYYLINKDGLPEDVRKQLVGGDAGEKKYSNYAHFQDVYGVTKDLKVFYCSNGNETRLGAVDAEERDDPTRVVMSSSSNLGNYLKATFPDLIKTDKDGNVLAENLSGIKSFELNNDTNVTSLSGLENLPGLTEIKIINQTLEDLNGIENLIGVTSVYLENVHITDYSKLSSLENLNTLYMLSVDNTQVANLCSGIADAKFLKLNNFGIFGKDPRIWGNSNPKIGSVSDISGLASLCPETKRAVTTLYLNNNYITDISSIAGFTSVTTLDLSDNAITDISNLSQMTSMENLNVSSNQIATLNGVQRMANLRGLNASNNKLGYLIDNNTKDASSDSLSYLSGKTRLESLNVSNNNDIFWVEYLSGCTSLATLNLTSCLKIKDIVSIAGKLGSGATYPSIYNEDLELLDLEKIPYMNKTKDYLIFKEQFSPSRRTNLKYLNLENLKLTKNVKVNGGDEEQTVYLTDAEVNTVVNEVLAGLSDLLLLKLTGINGLSEITFVKSVTGLKSLDLRNTMVTTGTKDEGDALTGLDLLNNYAQNLGTLILNDYNTTNPIQCKYIIPTLNRMNGYTTGCWDAAACGGLMASQTIYKTLESGCSGLKTLTMNFEGNFNGWGIWWPASLDLTYIDTMDKLTVVYVGTAFSLPSSMKTVKNVYSPNLSLNFAVGTNLTDYRYQYYWGQKIPTSVASAVFYDLRKVSSLGSFVSYGCSWESLGTFVYKDGSNNDVSYNVNISKLTICYESGSGTIDVNLSGIQNISGLNYLDLYNLKSLTGVENITNSTLESLYITGSNILGINSLSFVTNLTNLKELKIINAQISDLSPLVIGEKTSDDKFKITDVRLKNLTYLNLNNNSVKNTLNTSNGLVNNIDILNKINDYQKTKSKSLRLYIKNNSFTDVSGISWANEK